MRICSWDALIDDGYERYRFYHGSNGLVGLHVFTNKLDGSGSNGDCLCFRCIYWIGYDNTRRYGCQRRNPEYHLHDFLTQDATPKPETAKKQ